MFNFAFQFSAFNEYSNTHRNQSKRRFFSFISIEIPTVEFQATRKEFEGDITVVVFPMLRYKKGTQFRLVKI